MPGVYEIHANGDCYGDDRCPVCEFENETDTSPTDGGTVMHDDPVDDMRAEQAVRY